MKQYGILILNCRTKLISDIDPFMCKKKHQIDLFLELYCLGFLKPTQACMSREIMQINISS